MGIRTESLGAVVEVVLEDGDGGNLIDLAFAVALTDAVDTLPPSTRCVLLQAEGRNFCLGGDVTAFAREANRRAAVERIARALHEALLKLSALEIPVVVAVQGWAAGAGMSLALAADILIVADEARMKTAYNAIGFTPDGGMTHRLARKVPPALAMDLLLTDRVLDAEAMVVHGLASRKVAADELHAAARDVAQGIARASRPAQAATKRLFKEAEGRSLSAQLDAEAFAIGVAAGSTQGREGVDAFLQRRGPDFG